MTVPRPAAWRHRRPQAWDRSPLERHSRRRTERGSRVLAHIPQVARIHEMQFRDSQAADHLRRIDPGIHALVFLAAEIDIAGERDDMRGRQDRALRLHLLYLVRRAVDLVDIVADPVGKGKLREQHIDAADRFPDVMQLARIEHAVVQVQ